MGLCCVCVRWQHMREVAERRQQLELEHEQALAILKFKQDEIKRLQRVSCTVISIVILLLMGIYIGISLMLVLRIPEHKL